MNNFNDVEIAALAETARLEKEAARKVKIVNELVAEKLMYQTDRDLPRVDQLLLYEINSSWWTQYTFIPIFWKLAGKYYAWKIKRKLNAASKRMKYRRRLLKRYGDLNDT